MPATDQARYSFGEFAAAALPGHPAKGSWSLARVVAAGCGSRIVRDTWLIISGHPASLSRAAETLFLSRRRRVKLYNATSRPA